MDPTNDNGFPEVPVPFSPVQRALKFSDVFGTTFPKRPISKLPKEEPSAVISNFNVLVTIY